MMQRWLDVIGRLEAEHRRFASLLTTTRAPVADFSGLRPGVPETQILLAEERLGVPLMADMREFYRLTNGYCQANGWTLSPLEDVGLLRLLHPGLAVEFSPDSPEDAAGRRRRRKRRRSTHYSLNDLDLSRAILLSSLGDVLWLWDPQYPKPNTHPIYKVFVRDWVADVYENLLLAIENVGIESEIQYTP